MRVTPRTDEEINMMNLLPEGIYSFQVIKAEEKISKSNNEMIVITLKVWDKDGRERLLTDYLLDSFAKKIKHFVKVTGLENKYELGSITAEDCLNKIGDVHVIIQKGNPKPEGGFYSDKNSVNDYIAKINQNQSTLQPIKNDFIDDDLPF